MMLTHNALEVDAEGAVAWAAAHPGWYLFPGRMVWDEEAQRWDKRPLVRWTAVASKDPVEIRVMWNDPKVGGNAVICVACAPSGIWVLDQDRDLPADHVGDEWRNILEAVTISRGTLVLKSSTRGAPHYVFRQGAEWVAEGVWIGGEVKSSGMIVVSNHEPIVDVLPTTAPKTLLDKLKLGRPKGSHGRGACSKEELWDWLLTTPDDEDRILDDVSGDKFLDAIIRQLADKIEAGTHRRMAVLDSVFQAAIEASAGCYPAETAYTALKDAYRGWREHGDGEKGWTRSRELDFDLMWQSLVPSLRAGDHEDKVSETRAAALDRYGMWLDSDDEVNELIDAILTASDSFDADADLEESSSLPAGSSSSAINNSAPAEAANGIHDQAADDSGVPESAPTPDLSSDIAWGIAAAPEAPEPKGPVTSAPVLSEAALWGPHGDLIEALRGRTESSDIGVLGALLAFSGSALAGKAHFKVGVDVHGPNDYFLNIGVSSAARKSSALSLVERGVFFDDDRLGGVGGLFMPRRSNGVASGEAMIKVWQPIMMDDPAGGPAKIEEWPERRVIMIEGEASTIWKRGHREGSILSDTYCKIWDQADLGTHAITSGSTNIPAERHLMGFIGCSTMHVAVAAAKSGDGNDAKSGFSNRFVWLYLPDSKIDLPCGSDLPIDAVRRYQDRLGLFDGSLGAIGDRGFGQRAEFDDDAKELWRSVYGTVKRDKGSAGFIEAMLSRAESHVLRLALNYWLVSGGDPRAVGKPALEAALAVWAYAKQSVEYIFGGSTGSREADNLMVELESRGGWATMEELRFDLNKNTLASLVKAGVESGVMTEGIVTLSRPGRPPRAVALTTWLRDARLVSISAGTGRARGVPLETVKWDKRS